MRQTIGNHLRALSINVIYFLLVLVICIYYTVDWECFFFVQLALGVLFNFWAIVIHIQYAIRNAGEEIEIHSEGITIWKKGNSRFYPKRDFAKIMVSKSARLDNGGSPVSSIESYYYARISTLEGNNIFITCLMSPKVDKEIQKLTGVPFERRRIIYNFLREN